LAQIGDKDERALKDEDTGTCVFKFGAWIGEDDAPPPRCQAPA